MHSYTLFHSRHQYKFQKRGHTITSSGGSLSQAKLTTAHGAFSIQSAFVDLSGVNVKNKTNYRLDLRSDLKRKGTVNKEERDLQMEI